MAARRAEENERWLQRKYLDMDEFSEWLAARQAAAEGNNVVAVGEPKPTD